MRSKSRTVALVVAMALLLASGTWADDFYVVAGGGPPVGTKIASLPAGGLTISNPGFYFLGGNLTYSSTSGNAITISANDVTLDLMGFSLTGPGASSTAIGVSMTARSNVEIRNGTVRGFQFGIYESDLANGTKHRAINIRATGNAYGIQLWGKSHLIKDCLGSDNTSSGLGIPGSGLIINSVANNNGFRGFRFDGPGSFLGNTACNNTSWNFVLGNGVATSILVDHNSAFGLSTNYQNIASPTSGVVITANNSGTP